ncbi:hypothetical protein CEXT_82261 [Caerostris extrusa]|uniref:Uncharacterized protein n=1 Tax=Caerostris extrusa TaxID=172846 RepID=A0AAV4TTB3_CAEEX|nr:hypothetical protein CEXT_82261 [Caerostris extrusa]
MASPGLEPEICGTERQAAQAHSANDGVPSAQGVMVVPHTRRKKKVSSAATFCKGTARLFIRRSSGSLRHKKGKAFRRLGWNQRCIAWSLNCDVTAV